MSGIVARPGGAFAVRSPDPPVRGRGQDMGGIPICAAGEGRVRLTPPGPPGLTGRGTPWPE